MKIVLLDRETVAQQSAPRSPCFPHELQGHNRAAPVEVGASICDARVVVNQVKLPEKDIAAAPDLRLIAVLATGTENIEAFVQGLHVNVVEPSP